MAPTIKRMPSSILFFNFSLGPFHCHPKLALYRLRINFCHKNIRLFTEFLSILRLLPTYLANKAFFRSIISSILSIYVATSLTFSHLSILWVPSGFGSFHTRFVEAPAPHATMVCFSSMMRILYTPAFPGKA